jgi:hypothetical protein
MYLGMPKATIWFGSLRWLCLYRILRNWEFKKEITMGNLCWNFIKYEKTGKVEKGFIISTSLGETVNIDHVCERVWVSISESELKAYLIPL